MPPERPRHAHGSPGPEPEAPRSRAFWSGTISFGLVSIPVELHAAVRPRRAPLRMLGPEGRPLARRYFCSREGERAGPLDRDELVRGLLVEPDQAVVVTEEELAALEPRRSRDIDLRRFVDRDAIDPVSFDRPYVLAPSGQSTKAYHLLAQTLEQSRRAGIATFVMRGKEYLAAIFAEGGILRAQTLHRAEEVRAPEDVGLPAPKEPPARLRRAFAAELDALATDELDPELLRDEDTARLTELAERKRAASVDVVEVPEVGPEEDLPEIIDLMSVLRERIGAVEAEGGNGNAPSAAKGRRAKGGARSAPASGVVGRGGGSGRGDDLAGRSKHELYERARALDVPGRSSMSKRDLIAAIRSAERAGGSARR